MERNIKLKNFSADMKAAEFTGITKRISLRQVMILFFFSTVSGVTRIVTPDSGKLLSKSSWLAPFISLLPLFVLIFILDKIMVNHRGNSLAQIIETVFGKIIGKFVLFIYLLHILFFISFFLRNFGEKFVSSIFPSVSPAFFIIILLLFVLFAVRRNIDSFARFAEFSFIIISASFIVAFFIVVFHINPKNLYPVTSYDTMSVLKSSVPLISLWSLLTFSFFLGDNIRYWEIYEPSGAEGKLKRTAAKFMLITALFNFLALISVIGIFNAETAANMSMPYFMIFKSIKAVGLIQSFETFFIILWAFTDFIMISYYMYIMSKVFKTLFSINGGRTKLFMFPIAFIVLILSYLIGENIFEAEYFYTNILSYSSIILGYVFPFLLLLVGKIRKLL